jgi:hypothetical protein
MRCAALVAVGLLIVPALAGAAPAELPHVQSYQANCTMGLDYMFASTETYGTGTIARWGRFNVYQRYPNCQTTLIGQRWCKFVRSNYGGRPGRAYVYECQVLPPSAAMVRPIMR